MNRIGVHRNRLLLVAAFALGACGGGDADEPASTEAPAPNALAKRCSLEAVGGDGGFPAGLLPAGSVVTGDGAAVADGKLPAVFAALQKSAAEAGLSVRDKEIETLDAELELEGPDGDVGLRLELARGCPRATRIRSDG